MSILTDEQLEILNIEYDHVLAVEKATAEKIIDIIEEESKKDYAKGGGALAILINKIREQMK